MKLKNISEEDLIGVADSSAVVTRWLSYHKSGE